MDYRTLTSLMLRIAGVLILVQFTLRSPDLITSLLHFGGKEMPADNAIFFTLLALVLPLAIGFALIYFPSLIANKVVRAGEAGGDMIAMNELLTVAIACIGFYFVCNALFDGVYWLAKLKLYSAFIDKMDVTRGMPSVRPEEFAGMLSTALEFLVGLGTLTGARGLGRFVGLVRGFKAQ